MTPEEFKDRLSNAQPELHCWGAHVLELVKALAQDRGIALQILTSRVKDIDSAVGKLSRKSYKNPMTDMTDLVGVRAVCLLSPHVDELCLYLSAYNDWDIQKSRDTSKEYEDAPDKFGYQSHHFEIRAKIEVKIGSITVSKGTCCELQIRTLMQHAYAEVVHDSIYKSSWGAPSRAVRFVSSSAALIETADHLFCETMSILESETKIRGELLERLTGIYDSYTSNKKFKDQKFNMLVLENISELLTEDILITLDEFLSRRNYIKEKITSRVDSDVFWSQPVAVLSYLLAYENPAKLKEYWPFSESDDALELVYSDLGKKYRNH